MPLRPQMLDDLAALDKVIANGEVCIQRMEALVLRMQEKEEATADQERVILEMRTTLQTFQDNRDRLQRLLEDGSA